MRIVEYKNPPKSEELENNKMTQDYNIEQIDSYLLAQLHLIERAECKNMPVIQASINYVQNRIDQYRRINWAYADMIAKMLTDAVTQ